MNDDDVRGTWELGLGYTFVRFQSYRVDERNKHIGQLLPVRPSRPGGQRALRMPGTFSTAGA
jgi:hypothetical protein